MDAALEFGDGETLAFEEFFELCMQLGADPADQLGQALRRTGRELQRVHHICSVLILKQSKSQGNVLKAE